MRNLGTRGRGVLELARGVGPVGITLIVNEHVNLTSETKAKARSRKRLAPIWFIDHPLCLLVEYKTMY